MTAQTQSGDQGVARLRKLRTVAVILAVIATAVLVYGFGMTWKPPYQVAAGLAAWAAIEWQRRLGQTIKARQGGGS